jgi:ADP-heptose:LPS heptosyltransferase
LFFKKEKIGWSVFGRHYRLESPAHAFITCIIDTAGSAFFFLKRFLPVPQAKRICIIQLNHLGDMVMATAFTMAAKKAFPNAETTIIVRSMSVPIAQMSPGIDKIITLNAPWFARNDSIGWFKTVLFCIKNFGKYDFGFDLYGDPRNILLARLISRHCIGSGIRGFGFLLDRNVTRSLVFGKPVHENQLDLLRTVTSNVVSCTPFVCVNNNLRKNLFSKINIPGIDKTGFAVVHPGVSEDKREWPADNWKMVTADILERLPVICADYYGTQAKMLRQFFTGRDFHLVDLSLPEFALLLSCSKLVITVESLAGHLAAACGANVIVIHSGSTLFEELAPGWSSNAIILNNRSCAFSPCGSDKCRFGYPSPCTVNVSAEEVISAAKLYI